MAAVPITMTKKGYTVQSVPPAEYIIDRGGKKEIVMPIARINSPICPWCGVSEHSHFAIGCDVNPHLAAELADIL